MHEIHERDVWEQSMKKETKRFPVLRVTEDGKHQIEDTVVKESPLTIILDNQELVTLLCSPANLEYLAVGFLFSEGLIESKDDIKKLMMDEQRGVVRVETDGGRRLDPQLLSKRFIASGCGRGASFYSAVDVQSQTRVESQARISVLDVFALANEFQRCSEVFKATGGVHSAALCESKKLLVFSEDIGRHNAIDKIFGECLLKEISTVDRMVMTSGRISSEVLFKVAKRNIPVLISRSAPTDLALEVATDLGITLIGFVRGKRMNVYSEDWRVVG